MDRRRGFMLAQRSSEMLRAWIEPSAEEKVCPCGCGLPMVQIGEKVTDELEYPSYRALWIKLAGR